MRIRFSSADCRSCPLKSRCTRAARRPLTPRRREEHAALEAARAREAAAAAFAMEHRRRAGIEGTLSASVRSMHLRRSRYIGLAKTHLQHLLIAAAANLARLGAWLAGTPLARTRQSAFVRLMAEPC
jgi:IS5 family transposase